MKFSLKLPKTFDWLLYLIPILLVATGLSVIYSLTYFNDKVIFFNNQLIFFAISLVMMIFFTFFDYRHFKGISWLLYLIGTILLILVIFFGKSSFGATRWIDLKIFDLQPSEFFKLALIIILAKYLDNKIGQITIKNIIYVILIGLIPSLLILKQPDLGSCVVIAVIAGVMLLSARLSKKQLISIIALVLLSLPLVWFNLHDYQKDRIRSFINPSSDQFGSGYNVLQSKIAVGSGGLFGKGLGQGPQSQLNFLPVAHTDFIFAGLAEASGFVGSFFVILLFIILMTRLMNVANISKDGFGMFLAIGISTMIFFQVFINIGMNIGIMPVTGIPLPFVSYGGSSLLLNMICIGILQSIYLRHKKITF